MTEPKPNAVDPQTVLSLYGMTGLYGGAYGLTPPSSSTPSTLLSPSTTPSPYQSNSPAPTSLAAAGGVTTTLLPTSTLGLAASQAQSLGIMSASNAWWNMANHLATQEYLARLSTGGGQDSAAATEYLTRLASAAAASKDGLAGADKATIEYLSMLQAASRDPNMLAALQAQNLVPGLEPLPGKGGPVLTSSSPLAVLTSSPLASSSPLDRKSPLVRGSSPANSLEKQLKLPSDTQILKTSAVSGVGRRDAASPVITLPTGLTIEKKKPGRKSHDSSYLHHPKGNMVDRVEITRIHSSDSNGLDLSSRSSGLDLSSKNNGLDLSSASMGLDLSRGRGQDNGLTNGETPLNLSLKSDTPHGISPEKDNGLSIAEQIRQQQLASQLHKHLQQPGGLSAMQALLSLGRIQSEQDTSKSNKGDKLDYSTGGQAAGGMDGILNLLAAAGTRTAEEKAVASLLAAAGVRGPDEEAAVAGLLAASSRPTSHSQDPSQLNIPELTIRPVYRKSTSDKDNESVQHGSDDDSNQTDGTKSKSGGRQVVTDPEHLKIPLQFGWRRETTIRELNKSGVRGEVVYVAPCGKKFKQYPDIIRYIEKHGMFHIKRNQFSFSTKLIVGDFLKPTGTIDQDGVEKFQRFTAEELNEEIDRIRKEQGWKPRKRGKSQGGVRKSVEDGGLKEDDESKMRDQIVLQKETIRLIKENEKKEKAENLKKEKERQVEEKKRKQEELNRAKQEEKLKKMRELEMKKQQAAILKEQDKERRREHMNVIRHLDSRKKNEERRKKVEEIKIEKERERERRAECRRIETEISAELKRPIEDMAVSGVGELPDLTRICGMRLTGEQFSNLLMVFEFIHNFGETLNFDMDAIPPLDVFQSAILNESTEAEDELIGILVHLVMVAVEDPGVPNPLKQLTLLGQNLRQVEMTPGSITEVLRIFLRARAQHEIKMQHNLSPPEPKDKKEASQGPFLHADPEYLSLLAVNSTWQMAEWIKDKPFLALSPSQKTEILAFLCNELLNNKAVVNQIENTVENIQVVKRKKLILDNKVKKLKILHNRKYKFKAELGRLEDVTNISTASTDHADDKDDSMSVMSDSTTMSSTTKAKGGKRKKGGRGKKKEEAEMDSEHEGEGGSEGEDSEEEDGKDEEEDGELSAEDLQRKIEKVARLARKREEELNFVNNSLRASELGQDRFRRRYWSMAHTGGIWVEGMESAEPHEYNTIIEKQTSDHNTNKMVNGTTVETMKTESKEETKPDPDGCPPAKRPKMDLCPVNGTSTVAESKLPPGDNKENVGVQAIKDEKLDNKQNVNSTIGSPNKIANTVGDFKPKVTPNGERMNLFNHTAYFNMTLSQAVINGGLSNDGQTFGIARTTTPLGCSLPGDGKQSGQEKPWFNLVAGSPNVSLLDPSVESEFHPGRPRENQDLVPQLAVLEARLEEVKKKNNSPQVQAIPMEACRGWWKVEGEALVGSLEASLMERGLREQNLHLNLRRGHEVIQESTHKLSNKELKMKERKLGPWTSSNLSTTSTGSSPPATWSREVALRVEKMILEQIESLEDKVASASMQVPGWKIPDRLLSDTLKLRPSCEIDPPKSLNGEVDPPPSYDTDTSNVVEVCRQRLLELEAAVERRYLKAPLGASRIASLQSIAALSEKSKLDDSMDENEKMEVEDEEEDKENKDDNADAQENKENVNKKTNNQASTNGNNVGCTESDDPEDGKSKSGGDSSLPRGLVAWRSAVEQATNTSQLALAYHQLENSIAWDKSIMKARCQFCHGEEDENALLLCDSCDKAYHMYCFKPPITSVPDGDWYCWECVNKATGFRHCLVCGDQEEENIVLCSTCPRAYHINCITPNISKLPRGKWSCPGCSQKNPRKPNKSSRSSRAPQVEEEVPVKEESPVEPEPVEEEPVPSPEVTKAVRKKSARTPKVDKQEKLDKDMSICLTLISELTGHDESWPFINPVNTKQFPTYKKIIKHPMDINTIKRKLNEGAYKSRDDFKEDVLLVFTNCKKFNEDDSPVGRAGQLMKLFSEIRMARARYPALNSLSGISDAKTQQNIWTARVIYSALNS